MTQTTQVATILKNMPIYFRDVSCEENTLHLRTFEDRDTYTVKLNPNKHIVHKLDGSSRVHRNGILAGFNPDSLCVKILVSDDHYLKYRNFQRHGKQLLHGVIALFNNAGNYDIDSVKYNSVDKKVVFMTKCKITDAYDLVNKLGPSEFKGTILYELNRAVSDFRFIMRNIQISR